MNSFYSLITLNLPIIEEIIVLYYNYLFLYPFHSRKCKFFSDGNILYYIPSPSHVAWQSVLSLKSICCKDKQF